MKPKDFQQKTADRIVQVFKDGQQRVLLADEVGLGKTIVAREVVRQVAEWHKNENDDHFKVVYICSNINIANQNVKKLGIDDQMKVSESRLSMQHLKIYENAGKDHAYAQIIPLTPATSFTMTSGCGSQAERALMFVHLRRLPAFAGCVEKLHAFMAYDAEKYWRWYVVDYESKVALCDAACKTYIRDMTAELERRLDGELIAAIIDNCTSSSPERKRESRPLINRLRMIFAEISLDKLEPDLVIMDEFQRFRDLIAPGEESEKTMLSRRFLQDTNRKVLLLSATPYKPYSTLEEISADESADHYREFMEVMDFLFYDSGKRASFQTVWNDYSGALCEISNETLTALLLSKDRAEEALYEGICRTERFNSGVIDDSGAKEVAVSEGDILSYNAIQTVLDRMQDGSKKSLRWRNVPMDYVKSSPYLLSFMENYQLKKQIRDYYKQGKRLEKDCGTDVQYLLLKKSAIHSYRDIPASNARLQKLKDIVYPTDKTGPEALLWLPPSVSYYQTNGVFQQNKDYSKVLVFSSWEMVPRMISVMLSYEAEQRTIGKLFRSTKSKRGRGYFPSKEKEERRFGLSRLKNETSEIVCFPSAYLASLYDPKKQLGANVNTIRKEIVAQIQQKLQELQKKRNITFSSTAGAQALLQCIKALDYDSDANPTQIPADAAETMADMAIASPAVCAYRLLKRLQPHTFATEWKRIATEIAKEIFVSLFNKAESSAVLDLLYGDKTEDVYYQAVFRYCVEGNLQSMLDEYAYVLGVCGEELKEAMVDGYVDTVNLQIDTQESFPEGKKASMRTHFAVGYFNAKVSDKNVLRADRIRKAFNSPFRPFVLATTSIGQEGLDFHSYCRKVMHWNLPSNPVDLEQREGRVNRFQCLAVRQNVARRYGNAMDWEDMFQQAMLEQKGQHPDLVPYWCLPNGDENAVRIERHVPMYPFSQDRLRYDRIIKILSLYRLTLGQPRQEELIAVLNREMADEPDERLFMNLSPFYH